MEYQCIICGSKNLEMLGTTKKEVYVTGDRKRIERELGQIKRVICKSCGTVQFLQNDDYKSVVNEVYKNYDVMHDKAFSDAHKGYKPKLQVVYEGISEALKLSENGNMLDLGCGGGESLYWFHRVCPKWDLFGMDIGEHFRPEVIKRAGVKQFFSSLEEIEKSGQKFNVVTANNIISLANNSAEILRTVHDLLTDDGVFFVKDADYEVHPWILYEIESCSFYTKKHMINVIQSFGFDILNVDFEFEKKEIGVFCRKRSISHPFDRNAYIANRSVFYEKIEYLDSVIDIVNKYIQESARIGIFGTSIAGVWLSEIIKGNHREIFYVEEDEDFLGGKIGENGYPIYRLEEIVGPAIIFLPFPRYIAENIKNRCENVYADLKFIMF